MKVSELNALIESIVSGEIKKTIIEYSMEEGKKEVYHIMCDGEPVDTFETEEEAQEHIDKLKQDHPGKQFIIEKAAYESHDHMLDKLDEMGEQLEETDDTMIKKQPNEGNAFTGALAAAKANDEKEFDVDGKEYEVDENWEDPTGPVGTGVSSIYDEEEECHECGDGYMEEQEWTAMEEDHELDEDDLSHFEPDMNEETGMCYECGGPIDEETGMCYECGMPHGKHTDLSQDEYGLGNTIKGVVHPDDMEEHAQDGDPENICPRCGKQVCECGGMYESKKKSIRLKESELVELIKSMVNEAMKGEPGAPGIPGVVYTKKAQKGSGKENADALKDVNKKISDYLDFEGNDHSEFPHQNGVATKKAAIVNTAEQDEEVAKNFAGLQNLDYDLETGKEFKERAKKAIEGDTTMGNGKTTEKASIKPSNGADKGKEAKEKEGNHIQTPETAKKIEKQVKDRQEDKDNRVLYPKEKVPVSESKVDFNSILNEEIQKMKNLSSYNKKTQ
jgi:hypothetical protein